MNTQVALPENSKMLSILSNNLYPGAAQESVLMVIDYCKAAGLDPLQKPVHIVPMWDSKQGRMRDVVMPGIALYRINASRSNEYGGMSEPEFGPDTTETIGGVSITYPLWCRVTVSRIVGDRIVSFTAREFWKENYAVKGGKEKSIAPNAMWQKRPYAQIAKCAEAQALRKAFPEQCVGNTAEEMHGKQINDEPVVDSGPVTVLVSDDQARQLRDALQSAGKDEAAFCKKCRVDSVESLEASRFNAALDLIGPPKTPAFVADPSILDDVPF